MLHYQELCCGLYQDLTKQRPRFSPFKTKITHDHHPHPHIHPIYLIQLSPPLPIITIILPPSNQHSRWPPLHSFLHSPLPIPPTTLNLQLTQPLLQLLPSIPLKQLLALHTQLSHPHPPTLQLARNLRLPLAIPRACPRPPVLLRNLRKLKLMAQRSHKVSVSLRELRLVTLLRPLTREGCLVRRGLRAPALSLPVTHPCPKRQRRAVALRGGGGIRAAGRLWGHLAGVFTEGSTRGDVGPVTGRYDTCLGRAA